MKIEHFAINVREPQKMAAWWAEQFDLKIIRADEKAPFIHFLADDGNQTLIELYANDSGEFVDYGSLSLYTFHIAFAVEDIEAETARLVAAGGTQDGEIITLGTAVRFSIVRDPWGVAIQLLQRMDPLLP